MSANDSEYGKFWWLVHQNFAVAFCKNAEAVGSRRRLEPLFAVVRS